jgi:uncharacterized protein YbjQ (UPF0145 family)
LKIWIAGPLAALCGCTVHVEPGTSDVTKLPPGVIRQAETITVVEGGGTPLGGVEAVSCQKALHEPLASNEAALLLLKAKAASLGADGVSGVKYRHHNIHIAENCYDTVVATGMAVRR